MNHRIGTTHSRAYAPVPWGGVLLSAIAASSWAVLTMAGVAALGLHLLGADGRASLGPMTAAVVVLAAGGRVTPTGDVSVLGVTGSTATGAAGLMPLGVSLAGALPLAWVFLRALRASGPEVGAGELAARAAAVAAVFAGLLGGLAQVGRDTVTIDGSALGGGGDGLLGAIGGIGGIGDLLDAKVSVGFRTETWPSLLGGVVWVLGVLLVALLASRRAPLPPAPAAVRRVVGPAVRALCAVLLLAVVAGYAAAGAAAVTGDDPGRSLGGALLGAPNGVWPAVSIGLLVPWRGSVTGRLAQALPDPFDRLLSTRLDEPVTVGRLADLDGRVWLLVVAVALMMLAAGALAASRTPREEDAPARYAGRCALRLGAATTVALPLAVWLAGISVDAGLSVFGFDAIGAGLRFHGELPEATLLGALWGAGAGAAGAMLSPGPPARRPSLRGTAPDRVTGPTGRSPGAGRPHTVGGRRPRSQAPGTAGLRAPDPWHPDPQTPDRGHPGLRTPRRGRASR